jgi:hypothetical protein
MINSVIDKYVIHGMSSSPMSQSLFRDDLSIDSASVIDSSIASTSVSTAISSTIPPGIGSLSGTFIQGVGKQMLRGVEAIVVRRRLAYIHSLCPLSDNTPPMDVDRIYDELIELARCVIYRKIYSKLDHDGSYTDRDYTLTDSRRVR